LPRSSASIARSPSEAGNLFLDRHHVAEFQVEHRSSRECQCDQFGIPCRLGRFQRLRRVFEQFRCVLGVRRKVEQEMQCGRQQFQVAQLTRHGDRLGQLRACPLDGPGVQQ
jgi:hypothetical protein